MKHSISIITPVFNGEEYLSEVIESILKQSGVIVDYVIIDDGSTDNSLAIAEEYAKSFPETIRVFHQKNQGEASAVNFGISKIKYQYLCVVNSDDPLLDNHGRKMIVALRESNAVVAYPDWLMIDNLNRTIRKFKTLDYSKRALLADLVCIPGPGAVLNMKLIGTEKLRDENFRYISDYVTWVKLAKHGDFVRVPEILATWRNHQAGASAVNRGKPIADELFRFVEKELKIIHGAAIPARWINSAKSHAHYHVGVMAINGKGINGARHLIKSFALKPYPNFGYPSNHRSLIAGILVFLGPVGRAIVKIRNRRRIKNLTSNEAGKKQDGR
jgi:glycosyltransferase involved in cell wall biosynthesis